MRLRPTARNDERWICREQDHAFRSAELALARSEQGDERQDGGKVSIKGGVVAHKLSLLGGRVE